MVPNGWELIQLDEVCSKPISYGIVQTGEDITNGIPCARVVDLTKNEFDVSEMIKTTEEIHQSYKKTILERDELMMALRGKIGLVRIVPERLIGINITRGIARLAPKHDVVDAEFLLWMMRSNQVENDLKRKAGGSALQEISLTALRKVKLLTPPLPEQRKIAKILGTWDKAISITEHLIDNSKQQKKALMQQLLTGKKRLLDNSGKAFEGEWEQVTIGSTSKCFSGGTPSRSKEEYYGGDIPWITSGKLNDRFVSSVNEYISELGLKNSSAKVVKNGSLLIAMYGATAGKVAINKLNGATVNQAVLALEPNKHCHNYFLFYLFEVEMVKALKLVQGGQPNLSAAIIKAIKIKLPSLTEQLKIAVILTNAEKEVELLKQQCAHLKQEKKALMQQLLTGKRRVKVDNTEAA